MNYISYILVLIIIFISQYVLDLFITIKKNQEKLMERFSITGKPCVENKEIGIKNMFRKMLDYSGVNLNNDNEGYDIDNEYDLMVKDLMEYAEDDNNYYETNAYSDNTNTIAANIALNENVNVPIRKKEEAAYPRKQMETSIDKMYSAQNEKLAAGNLKTLKPDLWGYENEKVMNGGMFGDLEPFDGMGGNNVTISSLLA